ncbi:uncharacterized protein I206_104987 [Kwoniella pini CBS 10737]|uniref:Uncharacterized protein n=1 Tax=Kwoniella pini CBS 10737 TaxID=1296096 RepID=A0A1B9I8H0_9TREE|nr:uncharacterized protein I206_02526 [Kwoniella pini CBS 10737]OCF51810.1 hypothetical protein I206_02526 [Kwoniella pini CBS 10737]
MSSADAFTAQVNIPSEGDIIEAIRRNRLKARVRNSDGFKSLFTTEFGPVTLQTNGSITHNTNNSSTEYLTHFSIDFWLVKRCEGLMKGSLSPEDMQSMTRSPDVFDRNNNTINRTAKISPDRIVGHPFVDPLGSGSLYCTYWKNITFHYSHMEESQTSRRANDARIEMGTITISAIEDFPIEQYSPLESSGSFERTRSKGPRVSWADPILIIADDQQEQSILETPLDFHPSSSANDYYCAPEEPRGEIGSVESLEIKSKGTEDL